MPIALAHRLKLIVALAMLAASPLAWPQAWPDKPVRFIVPLPPGGPSDIVLRSAMVSMQAALKQPLVLENRPGAAGNIGAGEAARAAPDGYTWLWTTDTLVTVNPHVYASLGFRVNDLQPVMRASTFSQTLVCNPALGVRTVRELVARAKEHHMSYASGGAGSPGHLTTELFMSTAGIQMTHIPYKGPAPAIQDVIGGQVDCGFLAGPTVLPQVRAGKLVALAVSGSRRSALLPDVPTVAESGYPGFDASFSLVLFAPRGTPPEILQRMHAELGAALKSPAMKDKLRDTDQEVAAESMADSASHLASDSAKWGEVARRIKLHAE
jgi:tripartite-type tricarboxylate transporter receptor subunit TctC